MSSSGETQQEFDDRIRRARAAHEKRLEGVKVHASQILTFASDAMKAPALVALGGVVALLGFYSANYGRLSQSPEAMDAFGTMLFWLFTSLLLTVSAPGFAYFSQLAYTAALYSEDHIFEEPFCVGTRWSRFYRIAGDSFRWIGAVLVIASIGCLVRSGVVFFRIVT